MGKPNYKTFPTQVFCSALYMNAGFFVHERRLCTRTPCLMSNGEGLVWLSIFYLDELSM